MRAALSRAKLTAVWNARVNAKWSILATIVSSDRPRSGSRVWLAVIVAVPAGRQRRSPRAGLAAGAYQQVLHVYEREGSIPPCQFTSAQLQSALNGVDTYGAQYFADFTQAIQAALTSRAGGSCAPARAPRRSADAGRRGRGRSGRAPADRVADRCHERRACPSRSPLLGGLAVAGDRAAARALAIVRHRPGAVLPRSLRSTGHAHHPAVDRGSAAGAVQAIRSDPAPGGRTRAVKTPTGSLVDTVRSVRKAPWPPRARHWIRARCSVPSGAARSIPQTVTDPPGAERAVGSTTIGRR